MEFIDVGGYRVRYYENGKGRDILLIHGLGGSIDSWIYNRDELAKHFHVLAIDLLGFGLSDKPRIRYSIGMFVRFINNLLALFPINRVSLIGSSLGGQISAEFAMRYPEMVDRLILISPAGVTPYSYKGSKELYLYTSIFEAKDEEDLKYRLSALDKDAKFDKQYISNLFNYIKMENARYAFYSALRHSARAPRLVDRLDKIKARYMVIWGKDDKIIPVRYSKPFMNAENCRLVLLEGCGHRVHYEKSSIFNRLAIDFLNEL